MEYLIDGPLAGRFAPYVEKYELLLASSIQIYEVYRVLRRSLPEQQAADDVLAMRRAAVISVDETIALAAADVSLSFGLAMADSIIYATARRYGAKLVTADVDFEGLPDVVVIR